MPKALAMLVNIEEENTVMFYLLEEKKDIQVTVTDDLIAEHPVSEELLSCIGAT